MKTNNYILAIVLTLGSLITTEAYADHSTPAVAPARSAQIQYSKAVRAETYTRNNPNTVIGGSSQRKNASIANPWWKNRNDSRMNIRNGSNTMEIVRYEVYTYDRQSYSGSRINDSYRRTVRQVRIGQQVR